MDSEIQGTLAAEEAPLDNEEGYRSFWVIDPIFFLKSPGTIFFAPEYIRNGRASDFEPKLVSIGPYYHGRPSLQRMEQLKLYCFPSNHFFLKKLLGGGVQNPSPDSDPFMWLSSYARSPYRQKELFNLNDIDFGHMLIIDSCFIIQVILSYSHREIPESLLALIILQRIELRSDLLLLENQIPLFFIARVYNWFFRSTEPNIPPFETVLEPFIFFDMPWRINHGRFSFQEADHLLDLYWRCSSPTRQRSESKLFKDSAPPKLIPNATSLHQMTGIKFKKLNDQSHDVIFFKKGHGVIRGLDVIFSNGILRMPCLKLDSSQTTLLLNLIAYESSIEPSMRTFSNYMKIMDALIDSAKDVELLQDCGVIHNTLSSHQIAAAFFNDIGKVCFFKDPRFAPTYFDLFIDVHKYYDSSWNRTWASLRRNYFSSPWAGISVFAGVILLILSALQTFYTIYPYYNPRH